MDIQNIGSKSTIYNQKCIVCNTRIRTVYFLILYVN